MDSHANPRCSTFAIYDEALRARLCAVALATVTQERDEDTTRLFLCPACGHIELGQPPASCPICCTLAEEFVQV
jgi:rubrerythrin